MSCTFSRLGCAHCYSCPFGKQPGNGQSLYFCEDCKAGMHVCLLALTLLLLLLLNVQLGVSILLSFSLNLHPLTLSCLFLHAHPPGQCPFILQALTEVRPRTTSVNSVPQVTIKWTMARQSVPFALRTTIVLIPLPSQKIVLMMQIVLTAVSNHSFAENSILTAIQKRYS